MFLHIHLYGEIKIIIIYMRSANYPKLTVTLYTVYLCSYSLGSSTELVIVGLDARGCG